MIGFEPVDGGSTPPPATMPKGFNIIFLGKEDCPQTATAIDVSAITTALSSAITPEQVVTLLATAIGAGIGLTLVWFGARKLVSVVMTALKKGRLSI